MLERLSWLGAEEAGAWGARDLDKEQQRDRSWQPSAGECPPASTEGAVNKVLLKVIESEKLDDAAEGKRLGFPFGTIGAHTLPETRSRRGAGLGRGPGGPGGLRSLQGLQVETWPWPVSHICP